MDNRYTSDDAQKGRKLTLPEEYGEVGGISKLGDCGCGCNGAGDCGLGAIPIWDDIVAIVDKNVGATLCKAVPSQVMEGLQVFEQPGVRTLLQALFPGKACVMGAMTTGAWFLIAPTEAFMCAGEIVRLCLTYIANGCSVSATMNKEACGWVDFINWLETPEGAQVKAAVQDAPGGNTTLTTAQNVMHSCKPMLRAMCANRTPTLSEMTQMANAGATLSKSAHKADSFNATWAALSKKIGTRPGTRTYDILKSPLTRATYIKPRATTAWYKTPTAKVAFLVGGSLLVLKTLKKR